jgi:hypothetical protein
MNEIEKQTWESTKTELEQGCLGIHPECGVVGVGAWSSFIIPQPVPTAHQEEPNVFVSPPLHMHPRPLPER